MAAMAVMPFVTILYIVV